MKRIKLSPVLLMVIMISIGIIIKYLVLVISGGLFYNTIFFENRHFMDFFQHVDRFVKPGNVYFTDQDACFPAMAYVVYSLIYRLFSFEKVIDYNMLKETDIAMYIVSFYVGIFLLAFTLTFINNVKNISKAEKNILCILLCLSYPFALAIERGNISVYVMLLILLSMCLKDSESKVGKEFALILIALAASFKIYPAIFGLIYIREKRFKEAIRLVIYGIISFFAPFAFFGGLVGLKQFIYNITQIGTFITGISISGIVLRIIPGDTGIMIGKILSILFLVCVVLIVMLSKLDWKSIALLSSLMMIFISESGSYCLIYWTIPLVMFINNNQKTKMDYCYAVLFSLVFACLPIPGLGASGILYVFLYIQIVVIMLDKIKSIYTTKFNRKTELN